MKNYLTLFAFLVVSLVANAATFTHSVSSGTASATATVTATYNPTTGILSYSITVYAAPHDGTGGDYAAAEIGFSPFPYADGGPWQGKSTDGNPINNGTVSGTRAIAAGSHYYMWISLAGDGVHSGDSFTGYQFGDAVGTYKITFTIPKNETGHAIQYSFMQGETQVGSYTQNNHGAQTTVLIDGLETDEPVLMIESQNTFALVPDPAHAGQLIMVQTGEKNVHQVGSGKPTLAGATFSNAPQPVAPPFHPAPPVPTPTPPPMPTAPAKPTRPPGPTPNPFPNPTPSGAGGATTLDIQKQTNDLIDGINKHMAAEVVNRNAIVDSVDNGTDQARVHANGIITAVNTAKDATDKVSSGLGTTNGLLTEIESHIRSIDSKTNGGGTPGGTGGESDVAGSTAAAQAAASTAPTYAGARPSGSMGTGAAVNGITASSTLLPEATLHIGDRDVIMGRAPTWLDGPLAMLVAGRPLVLLALCVWFVWSCSDTVEKYVVGLSQAGTGGMSTVSGALDAVPGASLAKHLASSGLIVVVILAAAAAIVALVDAVGSRFGLTLSNLFNAVDLAALGPGIGWLDRYVPVGACISLLILRAGMSYLAAPLYLTATTTARFLHL